MSNEELEALTSGNVDLDSVENSEPKKDDKIEVESDDSPLPPPSGDDSKMVDQLDDVTKDSEKKASEIFDSLEVINESLGTIEEELSGNAKETISKNIEIFEKLTKKFPNITMFQDAIEQNRTLLKNIESMNENIFENQDEIMVIMDKMQYQDIHRQKIERVINVMRSLALYMNHLFSSSTPDKERVASAKHIPGDDNEDLVDDSDMEALIASFGK